MKYPLYIIRSTSGRLWGRFPDFPRVELFGSSRAEIEFNAQQVIEQAYDGSDQLIAMPTLDTDLRALETAGRDGIWVFVDIDLTCVLSSAVEIQFGIAGSLLDRIDAVARARHMTRGAFFSRAAQHELERLHVPRAVPQPLPPAKRAALRLVKKS